MEYLKIQIAITILATQVSALLMTYVKQTTLPYFPIEISRTAASCSMSKTILQIGFLTCALSYALMEKKKYQLDVGLILLGMVVLSLFDDVQYFRLHMTGVFLLFVGVTCNVCQKQGSWMLLLYAIFIYGLRIAMKGLVIAIYEQPDASSFIHYIQATGHTHMQIMYEGAKVCKHPEITIPVFQIGGVMQWVCFLALTLIM